MSKEIALHQQSKSMQINLFDPAQLETVQRVCNIYANSDLVPKMYKIAPDNPQAKAIANCMIALNMAQRLEADPLMIMQNMYIVHGQPAWSSKFLTATVNTCGRYESIKYRFSNLGKVKAGNQEVDNWECVAYTCEKGSDEILESIPVTIDMAIKEGWYMKNGSKWPNMPKLMLQYRAVTFWTRAYAPEISMGMKTDDEIQDIEDVPYVDVTEKVAAEKTANANKETIAFNQAASDPQPKAPSASEPKPEQSKQPAQSSGPGF